MIRITDSGIQKETQLVEDSKDLSINQDIKFSNHSIISWLDKLEQSLNTGDLDEALKKLKLLLGGNILARINSQPLVIRLMKALHAVVAALILSKKDDKITDHYRSFTEPKFINSPLLSLPLKIQEEFYLTQGDQFYRSDRAEARLAVRSAYHHADILSRELYVSMPRQFKDLSPARRKLWSLYCAEAIRFQIDLHTPGKLPDEIIRCLTQKWRELRSWISLLYTLDCIDILDNFVSEKLLKSAYKSSLEECESALQVASRELGEYKAVASLAGELAECWRSLGQYGSAKAVYDAIIEKAGSKACVKKYDSEWAVGGYNDCEKDEEACKKKEEKEAKQSSRVFLESTKKLLSSLEDLMAERCDSHHNLAAASSHESRSLAEKFYFQGEFSKKVQGLLQNMCKQIVGTIGSPPTPFVVLSLGSLTRHALLPASDIDIACLVQDSAKRTHAYFSAFFQLLDHALAALGDQSALALESSALSYLCPASLSEEKIPGDLLNTPKGLVNCLSLEDKEFKIPIHEAYSLYHARLIYSSSDEVSLYEQYHSLLKEVLDQSHKQLAVRYLKTHIEDWKEAQKGSPGARHIKKWYLDPLVFWVLDWGLYANIMNQSNLLELETDPIEVISRLKEHEDKILTPSLSALLTYAYQWLQVRRLLAHNAFFMARRQYSNLERDVLFTAEDEKVKISTLAPNLTLTEAEQRHLNAINKFLLQPLYAANQAWLESKSENSPKQLVPIWFTATDSNQAKRESKFPDEDITIEQTAETCIEDCINFLLVSGLQDPAI